MQQFAQQFTRKGARSFAEDGVCVLSSGGAPHGTVLRTVWSKCARYIRDLESDVAPEGRCRSPGLQPRVMLEAGVGRQWPCLQ